jgi:hypothetical protein
VCEVWCVVWVKDREGKEGNEREKGIRVEEERKKENGEKEMRGGEGEGCFASPFLHRLKQSSLSQTHTHTHTRSDTQSIARPV